MFVYKNVRTGREVMRRDPDPGLEASAGWETVAEPDPEPREAPAWTYANDPAPVGDETKEA